MMGICDIHQHVVFGVDDGAKDFAESGKMLCEAYAQGITDIVCTSHITPGYREFPMPLYLSNFNRLKEYAAKQCPGLNLYTGAEIMYTGNSISMIRKGLVPTLAAGWHALVEFMPDVPYDQLLHAVKEISGIGVTPVIAHIERYICLREKKNLRELRQEPVLLQMNASTVIRTKGLLGDRWARNAISNGFVDIVASDAHNTTTRNQNMREAYQIIEKGWGGEMAAQLCRENPASLLPRAP